MTMNDPSVKPGRTGARQRVLGRTQILDAAMRCLFEQGYDATTIRRIAGMLDCAVGSIYRYFKDKRELLLAATQAKFEPVLAHLDAGHDLEANMRMYLQQATGNTEGYRLMFWLVSIGQMKSDRPNALTVPPIIDRIIAGWSARIGDPETAGHCWAMLHGASALNLPGEEVIAWVQHRIALARQLGPHCKDDAHDSAQRDTDDTFATINAPGPQSSPDPMAEAQPDGLPAESNAGMSASRDRLVTTPTRVAGPFEPIARIGASPSASGSDSNDDGSPQGDD